MPITNFQNGLTDSYVDTHALNIDPAFKNYYLKDPKEIDQRRFNAYEYFMKFYKGRHWEETGEFNPAFGNKSFLGEEYNRRTWNQAKNIVDKLVSFLVKEPWAIKLPEELEEDEEIQTILDAVWYANNRENFSYDMAYMGCITGDCFVKLSYDPDFYAEDVGEIVLNVLDSRTVLPFFDGMDRRKMVGCRIQFPMFQLDEQGSKKQVMYTEVHTASTIVYLVDGEITDTVANPLGELLVVHIKNEGLPFERFGISDLEALIVPNKEYNEKISEISEILAYHAAPVTIIKGAKVQNLEKGSRKVWGGIPKDGDVYNLELGGDLSSSISYLEKLKTHIHETGGVPEEALGALQNVSNTSGAALHVQYQPLMERTQKKQIGYGQGLKKINELILKFYEAVGAIDLPEDIPPAIKYKTSIQWGDSLPRDRSIDLADISTEMGLQIESKKGALKRLGEENPEAKIEEIEEEALRQSELDFATMGMGGFGDPEAGPEGMGTAAGAEDGPQNDVSGAVNAAKTNPAVQGNNVKNQAVKRSAQETTGQNRNLPKP